MEIFSAPLRVKVDLEKQTVTLSIKTSEKKVEVHRIPMADFDQMIANYQMQVREQVK